MSKAKSSMLASAALIFFLGGLTIYAVTQAHSHEYDDHLRGPASQVKLETLKGKKREGSHFGSHFNKTRSYFTVTIHSSQPRPLPERDPATLEAEIVSRFDLENVEFSWSVPKSVSVSSGDVSGKIGPMTANQTVRIPITITLSHGGNHQIHFHVVTRTGSGELKGQVAQFNTLDLGAINQEEQLAAFESVFGDTAQERVKFHFVQ